MATITQATNRFGQPYWAVRWGPGMTQTHICLTAAEAVAVANQPNPGIRQGSVEPLVSFR